MIERCCFNGLSPRVKFSVCHVDVLGLSPLQATEPSGILVSSIEISKVHFLLDMAGV